MKAPGEIIYMLLYVSVNSHLSNTRKSESSGDWKASLKHH